jgi:hypothetical protein
MSRGAQTFTQSDVTKAIKAAVRAGLPVARVEISPEGRIIVIAGKAAPEQDAAPQTPLEEWRAQRGQG